MAIDPLGRELEFEHAASLVLPGKTTKSAIGPILVVGRFTEQMTRPMPGLVDTNDNGDRVVHTRTQEGCEVALIREADATAVGLAGVVVLARLVSDRRGRWRRDLRCRVRRIRLKG